MEPLLDIRAYSLALLSPDEKPSAVLSEINLAQESGEILCLVGESGSGKSVLARSVMGLLEKDAVAAASGEILFEGENLAGASERRLNALRGKKISMVLQDPMTSLNPVYTIGEQMTDVLRLHDRQLSRKGAAEYAAELLDSVGIADPKRVIGSYPFQISGGMRQRVMIAMALITRPEILIADEPTTALDVTVQKQVLDLIKKLQQDMGTSVILITHDLGVVRQYADCINVMYAGRIVESAPAKELLEHPRHAYTRALMKSIPGLHAKGAPLYTIPGLPPNMTQEPCGCSFRPRNTLGNPALCLTDREPELVEISPGHSVQNCPGCLA